MAEENVQNVQPTNEPTNFYDSWNLSDEDKGFIQSSNYSDPSAVIKALRETKSYVGADKNTLVRIPKADADGNVDYSEVYKQLGRPEKAEDYGFGDTDFAKAAQDKVYELGLNKKQAAELLQFWDAQNKSFLSAEEEKKIAAQEKGQETLKKEWGADYDANIKVVQSAVRNMAEATGLNEEDLENMENFLGTEKALKFFFNIGQKEGGVKSLSDYNAGQETPEIAAYKIKELKTDREFVKRLATQDPKAVQEINRLTAISMGKGV